MSRSYAESISAAPSPFASAHAFAHETEQTLTSPGLLSAEHFEVEAFVERSGREWARRMLDGQFALRGACERPVRVIGSDGAERTSSRDSARHMETLVGEVAAPRLAYQEPGHLDLHPLDAQLNLPTTDSFSHGVRRFVAMEAARSSYDEAVATIRERSGATISKRQVERLAVRAAEDFDGFYALRRHERLLTSDILVISTDGKGIVVRPQDLREDTRKRAEMSVRKVETRLTPGQKRDRKRIAQVATIYDVAIWERTAADVLHTLRDDETESARPKPTRKRVFASVKKSHVAVIREAFDEAQRRDPEHRRRWVVLVDGDAKQLDAVKAEAKRVGVEITIVPDIVHVLEYVWKAARAIFGETSPEAESWVGDRFLGLLTGRSGGDVAKTIRWKAEQRDDDLDDSRRAAIKKWTGRAHAGRSRARTPCCVCARSEPPVTSTTTGTSTSRERRSATMHLATPTPRSPTRYPRAADTSAGSSDRNSDEPARRKGAAPNSDVVGGGTPLPALCPVVRHIVR